ncbi:hypothetical protein BV25DRAFT_1555687 [Artomyces pyxidatus]|uniref:Uncharacterized protein n=1 Tax=Artomyces pyxidatus TaxID=48021 RepID=A0ACB8SK87_9AGAM|nr:hypothetical protein BV25DRAFT_1555687 [Artomyces pyxidatus]
MHQVSQSPHTVSSELACSLVRANLIPKCSPTSTSSQGASAPTYARPRSPSAFSPLRSTSSPSSSQGARHPPSAPTSTRRRLCAASRRVLIKLPDEINVFNLTAGRHVAMRVS